MHIYIYIYIYIIIYIYIYVIYKHESFESHKKPSSCGAQVFGMEHPKQFHTVGVSPALASAVLFKFANGAQHLTARGRIALSRADAMRCAGAYNKYNTFISSQQPLRCFLSLLQPLIRGSVRTPLLHTWAPVDQDYQSEQASALSIQAFATRSFLDIVNLESVSGLFLCSASSYVWQAWIQDVS